MRLRSFRFLLWLPFTTLFFGGALKIEAAESSSPEVKRESEVTLVPADALTSEYQKDLKDGKVKLRELFVGFGAPVVAVVYLPRFELNVQWPGSRTPHDSTIGNILNRGPPTLHAA